MEDESLSTRILVTICLVNFIISLVIYYIIPGITIRRIFKGEKVSTIELYGLEYLDDTKVYHMSSIIAYSSTMFIFSCYDKIERIIDRIRRR